jgi:GDP-mannose 6-dehydrogenase
MKVAVFGLGYVGCVSLGCLAQNGFPVIGVDISESKVKLINSGLATIIEKDIDRIIADNHSLGRLRATTDYAEAVKNSDCALICVGTPNTDHGDLNLEYVYKTAEHIGTSIRGKNHFYTVLIRSTVFPGTNAKVTEIIWELSGKEPNREFAVVSNPEFLREGTAVEDYYNPPLTVIGTDSDAGFRVTSELYQKISGPIERVSVQTAELIKYVNNAYHALKVVFANEIGSICKQLGIDSHEVMRIFCMDKQLNISSYYFKPGFAYGGSCLPKDLKAIDTYANDNNISTPILSNIERSNQVTISKVTDSIRNSKRTKIGVIGISFKSGTDDMRFSPIIPVIKALLAEGVEVRAYDHNVNMARIIGSNQEYLKKNLPFIEGILELKEENLIKWADMIVVNTKEIHSIDAFYGKPDLLILDLVRTEQLMNVQGYSGIAW